MLVDLENLPSDPAFLQRLVRDMTAAVESRDGEIERLQSIIKKLQRAQFGPSSERLNPDQLALALEELDADIGRIQERRPFVGKPSAERPSHRKPLPDHLPRKDVLADVDNMICACCGGALHAIGESVRRGKHLRSDQYRPTVLRWSTARKSAIERNNSIRMSVPAKRSPPCMKIGPGI